MRVLSFIPAFLLAATSFVAAAPSNLARDSPACAASGDENPAIQPYVSIITNAAKEIQPLVDQLTQMKSDHPNADGVAQVLVGVSEIIENTSSQLKAVTGIDLNGDLMELGTAVSALLGLVGTLLTLVLALVVALVGSVHGTLEQVVTNLLNSVGTLLGSLKIFVTGTLAGTLGPILDLLVGLVAVILGLLGTVLGAL